MALWHQLSHGSIDMALIVLYFQATEFLTILGIFIVYWEYIDAEFCVLYLWLVSTKIPNNRSERDVCKATSSEKYFPNFALKCYVLGSYILCCEGFMLMCFMCMAQACFMYKYSNCILCPALYCCSYCI